jgi:type VI secretion system protein ImpH
VIRSLETRGYAYEFHQVVRMLEWLARDRAVPLGRTADPSREAVRFTSQVSLAFPASAIASVTAPAREGWPTRVSVSFLGLASGLGPLPRPLVEHIIERVGRKDTALRDFLDLFNHRLVSYHYRTREKHRPGLRIAPPDESQLAGPLFALMGMGEPALRSRLRVPDRALLAYAGTLSRPGRSAASLAGLLRHYFEVPVEVRAFQGRWRSLEPDQWTRLGAGGENRRLGLDAALGTRLWDQESTFELRLGPMGLDGFRRFLPGSPSAGIPDGDRLAPLTDLTRLHAGEGPEFRFRLVLERGAVPETRLATGGLGSRLGHTSWLRTRPAARDADQVVVGPRPARPVSPLT